MPRFFFDLILGSTDARRDHAGVELPDVDAARREALKRLADAAEEGAALGVIALDVLDARSVLLARLSIVAHAPVGDEPVGDPPRGEEPEADHAAWLRETREDAGDATRPADPAEKLRTASRRGNAEGIAQRPIGSVGPLHLPTFGVVKADGLHWTVIDLQTGSAARYDLRELVRLTLEEAEEYADRLNFRAQCRAQLLGGRNMR